jgi:hypothetical protein
MFRGLFRHASNVPALAIGVLVGAVMLSGVAVAAAPGLVTIADSTGTNKASVNGAGQLLAAETNPRNTVLISGSTSTTGVCASVYTVPLGKALIIKSGSVLTQSSTGDPAMYLYKNGCTVVFDVIASDPDALYSSEQLTWPVGIPVASGKTVDLTCFDTSFCAVHLIGYLVPSTLVPSSSRPANPSPPNNDPFQPGH